MTRQVTIGIFDEDAAVSSALSARYGARANIVLCRDVSEWMSLLAANHLTLLVSHRYSEFANAFLLLGLTRETGVKCPFWVISPYVSESDDALMRLAGIEQRIDIADIKTLYERVDALVEDATGEDDGVAVEKQEVGLFEWNLSDHSCFFSPAWQQVMSVSSAPDSNGVEFWRSLVLEADQPLVEAKFNAMLHGEDAEFSIEHRISNQNDSIRWIGLDGKIHRDSAGKVFLIEGRVKDISAEKHARRDLVHYALHDPSGLANQAFFTAQLERLLKSAQSARAGLSAVVFFNFSRLQILAKNSEVVRKQAVQQFAAIFEREFRTSDVIALIDDNAIGVILENLHAIRDAHRLTNRVIDLLNEPLLVAGHEIKAAWNAGIVPCDPQYTTIDELIRAGETALYHSMASTKHTVKVVETHLSQAEIDEMRMDMDLKHAFEREEFRLLYQPIVAADTGTVVGLEALLRWRHPIKGLLTPHYFMEAAEVSGLLIRLNRWALSTASKQVSEWQERFKRRVQFTLNFNIGEQELCNDEFTEQVQVAIQDAGMAPRQLNLEISEDALLAQDPQILKSLTALSQAGIRLCIHDFGRKHAPISALLNYPIDAIKLHPVLTRSLHVDEQRTLISSVIGLADTLGVEVTALGVEESQQRTQLRDLGCGIFQGYSVAQPTDAKNTPNIIKKGVQIDW